MLRLLKKSVCFVVKLSSSNHSVVSNVFSSTLNTLSIPIAFNDSLNLCLMNSKVCSLVRKSKSPSSKIHSTISASASYASNVASTKSSFNSSVLKVKTLFKLRLSF